jgi:mannan endo-1,4-beta-mannosidase
MKLITGVAAAVAITSCGSSQESVKTPADALLERLAGQIEEGKIMFGHQDTYLYGHSWKVAADASVFDRSDIHDVAGVYPALSGMDLGGIELDSPYNIDNNDFNHMRASAVAHHQRGGVVTFSWHPRNPLTGGDTWDTSSTEVVASILPGGEKHELFMGWLSKAADYLASIKTADGEMIPVIFRPWHEHTRDFFWWGKNLCTKDQYVALWRMTYDYMTVERGLDHLVWSYSPDAGGLYEYADFGERYPGDDIIDMVGIDFYQFTPAEEFIAKMKSSLDMTQAFAKEHGKLMAVTETGCEGIKDAKWWTEILIPSISEYPLSYVLLWRNACDEDMQHHFYGPHPDHDSVEDFKNFAALDQMMFVK